MAKGLLSVLRAGLVTKDASRAVAARPSWWGMVTEPFSGAWQAGVTADPIGQITAFGAVFACITRIANDIAKLEFELKMEADGICVDAPATSPYRATLVRPNPLQNRIQFITWWLLCKLIHGNAYQLKARDNRGIVNRLFPLDPRRVLPLVTPEGDVYYSLAGDHLARLPVGLTVPASEIIHDRGATLWHPLIGIAPLYAAAASATMGARIQGNSAKFFENMSRPSGMLTAPDTISDDTALRLKQEFERNFSGQNIGKLLVAGDGLKYEPMTIPAQTSQLIEQLGWNVADVARCFGMPLYKINAGPEVSRQTVEEREIEYYTGCLQIHIEAIELCLTEGLELGGGATAGYEVQCDLDGLLRMDSKAKTDMLVAASGGAYMMPNEARAKMGMAPTAGGDQLWKQQQDHSLAALAKRDAQPDPFGTGKVPAPAPALPAPTTTPDPATAAVKQAADAATAAVASMHQVISDAQTATRSALDALRADITGLDAKALSVPAGPLPETADEGAAVLRAAMARARKVLSHAD